MNAVVIYKSKSGFTKKYAQWIAQALSCKAIPAESAKTVDLSQYDTLVFGGWLFVGSIQGLKSFQEKLMAFSGKKAVFAVGAMPPDAPEAKQALNTCFTEEERKNLGTFFLQGGLDYAHMGMVHKAMMKMMCRIMKKQKGVNSTEYKTVSKSFDATDKAAIQPIINYITQ